MSLVELMLVEGPDAKSVKVTVNSWIMRRILFIFSLQFRALLCRESLPSVDVHTACHLDGSHQLSLCCLCTSSLLTATLRVGLSLSNCATQKLTGRIQSFPLCDSGACLLGVEDMRHCSREICIPSLLHLFPQHISGHVIQRESILTWTLIHFIINMIVFKP